MCEYYWQAQQCVILLPFLLTEIRTLFPTMDNPELILQSLEHFPKLKDEEDYNIPVELEEYIHYVAKTGDPVFQWTLVKPLFREKIIKVITDFFESNSGEIPDYPNVAKFNYDTMKETLLERIDWFKGAPFTIQRISELLVNPTKEYNRVDKYMRALEKNIYVVSTREPGMPQPVEENNSSFEESFILNGNDFELKSENNEDSGTKEEDEEDNNAAALLLLKKCSNGETDDSNFNIEVDVTNTTTAEDAQEEKKLDSGEINVHDEIPNTSEMSSTGEGKCGQTRKLEEEEDDQMQNESKRFKMDDDDAELNDDESKEDEVITKEVVPQADNINTEPLQGTKATSQSELSSNTNNDDSCTKEEEEENINPDEANINIEIDGTNTNKEENVHKDKLDVGEINVHDGISNTNEMSSTSEDSSDQTSKLEEEEVTDEESKKDDNDTEEVLPQESESSSNEETSTESTVLPPSDDMIIEPLQETEATSQSEETSSTSNEENITESKVEVEMELEETVNNKIESFDNNKSESSLDMSEGDSMVISQESASSSEENADKSIEKVDMVVSESSDMDLSDGADKK